MDRKKKTKLYSALHLSLATQWRIVWLLLAALMVLCALWLGNQAVVRYDTFKATAFDLGNMDQAIWNTLHGRLFQFTNHGSNWYGMPIRLAQHVEPIILPLSLLYFFHADVRILLIFQVLALTAGALPVFLLTRRYLSPWPFLALVMAAAYLLSPAVISENIFDFHPLSLATPLLLYALLALTYRRYYWFILACLLAAMTKEEMPAVVGMLGLLLIWKYKLPRLGALFFVCGMTAFLISFLVIIPHFNTGALHNNFWYRYEELGSSPIAAIGNVLLHPWLPFTLFLTLDRIYYLFSLFRSTGFLALLSPEWLLPALPSLAINLLSSEYFQHSGVYHYNAAIVPFVIVAAIHGLRRLFWLWYGWQGDAEEQERYHEAWVLTVSPKGSSQVVQVKPLPGLVFLLHVLRGGGRKVKEGVLRLRIETLLTQGTRGALTKSRIFYQRLRIRGVAYATTLACYLPTRWLALCCGLWIVGMFLLNYSIATPLLNIFWPDHAAGVREQHIQQLLQKIPADAAVSAGGNLNPHLSERQYITVFPELTVATLDGKKNVEYVVVDLTNISPEDKTRSTYFLSYLNQIQQAQQFHIVAQAEGVILLVRQESG